jgi:methionyl-tRNA synthetase
MSSSSRSLDRPVKRFLVTQALPYANGDIHLGHLVEAVQTDVFVRFQKMMGHEVVYVCADDTHGTPIELTALRRGVSPVELIAEVWKNHVRDYAAYTIDFDIFYTTNSEENRHYAEFIYAKLREKGLVVEREIEQFFDEREHRFLPDRFIRGSCPRCAAADQYGDVCEACGATYNPTELKDPRSALSQTTPVLKKSVHFFVELAKCEQFLRDFVAGGALAADMRSFVQHWIDDGLKEWCISRDGPYFGFPIPGAVNKFFYVWLDAPIGYLSSTAKWCAEHGRDVAEFWGKDSPTQLVHFIGKDIVYFHALFWPVMLNAAGFKIPDRLFVHGFLNINDEKMSKTRGTFILAREFAEKMKHPAACEYLRFYFAAKLTDYASDIDFNVEEFCNRVNTTLANNIGNLHHRTFVFIDRFFGSIVPDAAWDESMSEAVAAAAGEIAGCYERSDYKTAIGKVHALASQGNKYYQDSAPWELIKKDRARAGEVMVTCVNLVKALAVFLKPIVPGICAVIEQQLGQTLVWDDWAFSIRNSKSGETKKMVQPILAEDFAGLMGEPAAPVAAHAQVSAPAPEAVLRSAPAGNIKDIIEISDFSKVDLRIGTIESAEPVPKSDKLLRLQVSSGAEKRQIVAGIAKHYAPETLIGRQIVFIANLKPAKLMGLQSQGMVLAAQDGAALSILGPDKLLAPGAKIS